MGGAPLPHHTPHRTSGLQLFHDPVSLDGLRPLVSKVNGREGSLQSAGSSAAGWVVLATS